MRGFWTSPPTSIVHSLVRFRDGATLAHLGYPDMRVPISFALTYPERAATPIAPLDLASGLTLEFRAPDSSGNPYLNFAAQMIAILQPRNLNAFGHRELSVDFHPIQRLVLLSQVASSVNVGRQTSCKCHKRRHSRSIGTTEFRSDRTHGRIASALTANLSPLRFRVSRLKRDGRVIAGRGIHRSNDGELVHHGGDAREKLTDMRTRHVRRDGPQLATDILRRLRFRIERVVLAGRTKQEQQDARPGLAKTRDA